MNLLTVDEIMILHGKLIEAIGVSLGFGIGGYWSPPHSA